MFQMIFMYEENGFTVSRLSFPGDIVFVIKNKTTGRIFIRRSISVVDEIVKTKPFD